MRIVMLILTLGLAGCITGTERQAAYDAEDDAKCVSFGAKKGSPPYFDCRMRLERDRADMRIVRENNLAGSAAGNALTIFGAR